MGNISVADVKLLTNSSSLPLLHSSCIHFISVILTERGIGDGKDSFPVFHVNPYSTLAHTCAKLVATRSHRMWVVEAGMLIVFDLLLHEKGMLTRIASPSPSLSATPLATPSITHAVLSSPANSTPASPSLTGVFPAVSAAGKSSSALESLLSWGSRKAYPP